MPRRATGGGVEPEARAMNPVRRLMEASRHANTSAHVDDYRREGSVGTRLRRRGRAGRRVVRLSGLSDSQQR